MNKIQYGTTIVNNKLCEYACWELNNHIHELISISYEELVKLIDNKKVKLAEVDIMIWSEIINRIEMGGLAGEIMWGNNS